ncbi:hypothetical protein LJ656_25250 [Paraburkholderia sp. MMS20-SJTR3]|uniref:Uncharacterized protein n=1 Tax=Paraburkholderia sejongensis TaxID=2886946 RepID=A0ABS8K174_9BURK|nr:hypothetical protein [Paraburkholderia sp. MMS20-SJTR3]MCC8395897.1 hypothetical protein [Paraburkholderia sp. MMS20-SJTR3]
MKRIIQRGACGLAFVVASLVGGWWLGEILSSFSFAMPYWLDVAIRAAMHMAGEPDPLDPEDIETIGLVLLFVTYCIVVAVVLASALRLVRGYLGKRLAR